MKKYFSKFPIMLMTSFCGFIMFCFLPERLIVAALLAIFLLLVLNGISAFSSSTQDSFQSERFDQYEMAKSAWKKELEHDLKIQEIIKERETGQNLKRREHRTKPIQIRQNRIMRVVEIEKGMVMKYQEAKNRWRMEMNDQVFEKRVQSVFKRIRNGNELEYQQGLEEIQRLLSLRSHSLSALTAMKKSLHHQQKLDP